MNKKTVILIATFLSCAALCAAAKRQIPLRNGFGLTGVDGKLSSRGDKWFFEFDSDISDDVGRISAGSTIELLPSTALEKITADAKKRPDANYRLWGNVTKYKHKNFIFPIYFLPISPAENKTETKKSPKARITINEPNDTLAIPQEIVNMLKNRRILRQEQLKEGLNLKQDSILASRTAIIAEGADGEPELILDALGRNIQQITFKLLPCEALLRAQYWQSIEADPIRFKIAGILTQYKGEYYLLLQKATRAYSHENFGR